MIQNVDVSAEKTPRKKKIRHIVAAVLLGIIVIYIVSGAIFWKIGMPAFMFEYEKNDKGGITITDYLGPYLYVHIPDKIDGVEVTEIGYHAFSDEKPVDFPAKRTGLKSHLRFSFNDNIREVIIPDSVEKIGAFAFDDCENLTNVNMPSSLREIELDAFSDTKIKELDLPEGMTKIDYHAFAFSYYLEKVTLPDSIEEIDRAAFDTCRNLKEINVPAGLKRVGEYAFYGTGLSDEQKQAFYDKAEEVID